MQATIRFSVVTSFLLRHNALSGTGERGDRAAAAWAGSQDGREQQHDAPECLRAAKPDRIFRMRLQPNASTDFRALRLSVLVGPGRAAVHAGLQNPATLPCKSY